MQSCARRTGQEIEHWDGQQPGKTIGASVGMRSIQSNTEERNIN